MSGFFLTPMTRVYAEMLQGLNDTETVAGAGITGCTSFRQTVQDKLSPSGQTAGDALQTDAGGQTKTAAAQAGGRNEQLVQSMTMEQYKLYIYQKISALPMSPTQKWDAVSVNISEEGFAAMKADPAYEKWVLDTLRNDFAFYNPWSAYTGGSYRIYYFGATREEYRGESYPMGFRNGGRRTDSAKKKKEKNFWEKRAERHKLYMDLAKKAWYKRENEREYQQEIDFGRKEVSSAILKQHAIERATGEHVELDANTSVLSRAATEFAQNYVFVKIHGTMSNTRPKSAK